jgi:aspartate/methionine/tyrosine aminotransferase
MSQTKAMIIERHDQNTLLNAAVPFNMVSGSQDLSANEMFAALDERIIASTLEALEAGQTHYVDVGGISPLREALAQYLNKLTGTRYQPNNVIVAAGVQEARFLTTQMIGERFGRIAVPAVVYPGVLKAIGVRALPIDRIEVDESTMLPTLDGIRKVLEAGCRLLYLESPSRLTGAVFSAQAVSDIWALLTKYDAAAIWDQGLAAWVDGDYVSLAQYEETPTRVATLGEAWDGMGLASWFIGYIAAPPEWCASMISQKQIMAICTSTPTQFAALEASKLFAESHAQHLKQLAQRRARLFEQATAAGLNPIAGEAVNILALKPAPDFVSNLQDAGYQAGDGSSFGAAGVVRLNVTPNSSETALQTIR